MGRRWWWKNITSLLQHTRREGGASVGCPGNFGGAGTLTLIVSNDNYTIETETPLLDFSTSPLWSKVFIQNRAKALVPLLWTRVQSKRHLIAAENATNVVIEYYPFRTKYN